MCWWNLMEGELHTLNETGSVIICDWMFTCDGVFTFTGKKKMWF